MKKIIFNVIMCIATVPLIILLILGTLFKSYGPTFILGMPFIILGTITLFLNNKLLKVKEVI
ncbi:hypothetical protein QTH62_01850 [Clostridium perfringens]|nr:hypothetical protein [Clostridium perfringens]